MAEVGKTDVSNANIGTDHQVVVAKRRHIRAIVQDVCGTVCS
jgi:hypothetical protein